jgi:hypothetical protein
MTKSLAFLSLPLILALAACQATPSAQGDVASGPVEPGTDKISGVDAAIMFSQICLDTKAQPAKAKAVLAELPFRQHPQTGTYFHQNLNMSVKLMADGGKPVCSMVVATTSDPTLSITTAASAANLTAAVRAVNGPDGVKYTHALASAN